jgi:biopolymer transport protein ExbD
VAARFEDADGSGEDSVVAEINITPLTDIFLVLLVIFMVTSTAAIETVKAEGRGIRVSLPQAAGAQQPVGHGDPVLTIKPDGSLFLGDRSIREQDVRAEVEKALKEGGGDVLVVRADRAALFGRAVTIMGEARKAGAQRITVQVSPQSAP